MLAHRERHVVEHRHIGEQCAELKQHAHAPAQHIQIRLAQIVEHLVGNPHFAGGSPKLAANKPKQGRLAAAAATHDRNHLAARYLQVDPAQDLPLAVRKAHATQAHQRL